MDALARHIAWRGFAGVTYFDGQGFLVRKSLKVNSALELNSASVCVQTGTTTEQNLADYFKSNKMKYEVIAFSTADETIKAYRIGRCDVFTSDISQLYAERLKLANPADHAVLPEVISKEPLGPMVRHGDDQWFDLVKWTLFAMINAEELGITQKNVDEMAKSDNPETEARLWYRRQFRRTAWRDQGLGCRASSRPIGNYGKSFDRNVGAGSKLGWRGGSINSGTRAAFSTRRRSVSANSETAMAAEPGKPPPQFLQAAARVGGRAGWGGFALQVLFVAALAWISYEIVANARGNLETQHIASGFDFMSTPPALASARVAIPYSESDITRAYFWSAFSIHCLWRGRHLLRDDHRLYCGARPAVTELADIAHFRRLCRTGP